ncbi:hypothetical protein CAEBREN_15832 [Caenorhabditis brenneri]|uniref:ATP-dependent DNA helicase n=1 Tax=Caenorhabditis brenneri TaxID=135651 RepID=G0NVL8_CAEBE|nr:hypothetical protein CAEBREN_15832 [Caenorhabditis brenneri]
MPTPPFTNPKEPEELLDYVFKRLQYPKIPLRLLVVGRAGSGKSTFIRRLLKRLGGTLEVMNLTTRNTAANETGGQTVFKKLHIDYQNIEKVLETECKFYPRLGLVILDEISLFYGALVDLLDKLIAKMKDAIGEMFGNVHIIMVGDFLQLADKKDGAYMYDWDGFREFEIRFLSTNFRQARDTDFCQRLDRWAVGLVNDDDANFLEERCVANNPYTVQEDVAAFYNNQKWDPVDSIILTSSNKDAINFTRKVLNGQGIHHLIETDVAIIKIVPDSPKQLITFRPVEKPSVLVVGIKAQIIFTKDTFEQTGTHKIDRGTIGEISKITIVRNQIWAISLIIKGYNHPLTFQRILVKTKKTKHETESLAVFNFRNGIATTFNQAQGRTLKRVMIDTSRGDLYPAQFYTGASRVCNADALHLTHLPSYETKALQLVINPDKGAIDEIKKWKANFDLVRLPSDVANVDHDDDGENTPKPE